VESPKGGWIEAPGQMMWGLGNDDGGANDKVWNSLGRSLQT